MRWFLSALVGLVLVGVAQAGGGDDNLAGSWKVTIFENRETHNYWILKLANKDGKLTGTVESLGKVPPSVIENIRLQGDQVLFNVVVGKRITFEFECKLPRPGAKKIYGSMMRGGTIPVVLESTQATNQFELDRELVTRSPSDPRVFDTVMGLIRDAKANKADAKDVKQWVDQSLKSAENHGSRWSKEVGLKILDVLGDDWSELALDVGKSIEAGFDAKTPMSTQLAILTVLSKGYKKTGQEEKAKEILTKIDKLEGEAYKEYSKTSLGYEPEKYQPKGKGKRSVLVELFTGAQCPPCVAADLAFDGLEKTYPGTEVVLLQYHLHIPGPDALTNPDAEARQEYYGDAIQGTPTILFNGKPAAAGGGGREGAKEKYKEYREVVEKLFEKPAVGQLSLQATRKGDNLTIKVGAKEIEKPNDKVRLRLVLVEDWVRYQGRNGLSYHHRVVRAFPGGPEGFAVKTKDSDQNVTMDLGKLQKDLTKYLDTFARNESPFPDAQRPLRLRDLYVAAFLQDDATKEVLAATEVKVKDE